MPGSSKRGTTGLSVLVPCYNEELNIAALVSRLLPVCRSEFGDDFEVLLVNDGSRDGTWHEITAAANRSPQIVGIDLSRNHGHQLALSAAMEFSRGNYVLVIDADLQDPPELLPKMMERVRAGYDVVYGQRISRAGESAFKKHSASLFYRFLNLLTDTPIPADTGDFRLMTRRVVDQVNAMPERFRYIRGMVSWVGYSQCAIEYERDPRHAGETNYPLRKMLTFAADAITSFSIVPLRFASHLGMAFGIAGVITLCWVGFSWIRGDTIAGWTSLAALILILGSVQLLVLGVFGEYLGRMYIEAKRRPLFIVQEVQRGPAKEARAIQDNKVSQGLEEQIDAAG